MRRLAVLAALLVACPAWAGLPVAYDAELKAFKNRVRGGDLLGFSLYKNEDCSGTPVYSQILGAGTPEVIVEEVPPVRTKQGDKTPNIARLRAVLSVEAVDMALYLRVQGDGVEPVGGACQVQVAAVVGTPGPQGPQRQAGPQGEAGVQGAQGDRPPGEQRPLGPSEKEGEIRASTIDPSLLAVFVLLTCLACIYMVFFFGRRLQTSAYLRDSLIEGAKEQELKALLRELHDRAIEGPLDPQKPPPDGYGSTRRLWESDRYEAAPLFDMSFPGESAEQRAEREKKAEERRSQLAEFRRWESEERVRYEALRQQAAERALRLAEQKIPSSIDISLLGGGWAFLLEFSTVIVIIFTLLIFGILKTLEGEDISTILASIAGYVLGKATAGARQQERPVGEVAKEAVTTAAK